MKHINTIEEETQVVYEQVSFEELPIKTVKIDLHEELDATIPKHWHRSVEILIPRIGGTIAWVEGVEYTVQADDFLIINSKEIHACRSYEVTRPYFGYAIQIKYDFLKACFPELDAYAFTPKLEGNQKQEMLHLMNKIIASSFDNKDFSHLQLHGATYDLLYQLLAKYCFKKTNGCVIYSTKHKEKLVKVLSYLDETLSEPFDAKDIAAHFHLSYGYLAKLFKTYVHMTMKEYVDNQRIERAKKDLLMSDKPIIDIALDHGFVSTKAFYREFKKHHPLTPKEYRNNKR